MRIGIDAGHCLTGADTGASKFLNETTENRIIKNHLIKGLRDAGHTVIDCTVDTATSISNSLAKRVNIANNSNLDLFISLHLNAGAGTGSECWIAKNADGMYVNNSSYTKNYNYAKDITAELAKGLGIRDRGVKHENFYVVANTKCHAVLIEVCFVDNEEDKKRYNALNASNAILKAITGKTINNTANNNQTNSGANNGATGAITETTIKEYKENGKCTITEKIGIMFFNQPRSNTQVAGSYECGESVYYDYVVITNKYTYISWISSTTGQRRYMPITDRVKNEKWAYCV